MLDPLLLSFEVALWATCIAAVAGVLLGAAMARATPGRDLLDVVLTTPLVLPPTVLGYYVLVAVGRDSALGTAFENLTGTPVVFTKTGAILAATVSCLPLVT